MQKIITRIPVLMAVFFMLSGFSQQNSSDAIGQPSVERKAQDSLPQSHDEIWVALGKCKVSENKKTFDYSIEYTAEVKAMEGKQVTIKGFMLPLESTEKFKHFLLSKRTPTCPFCPPGKPNEFVEVFTKKPVIWNDGIVSVTGTMKFTSNPQLGLFFQLSEAESKN